MALKDEYNIGDKVILIESFEGLLLGSEGTIGYKGSPNATLSITKRKKGSTAGLHNDNGVKNAWNVPYSKFQKIKEPELESINMDFGELCSESIDDFLKKR